MANELVSVSVTSSGGPGLPAAKGLAALAQEVRQEPAQEGDRLQLYEERRAAIKNVEQQAAAAADFIANHSLLRPANPAANPIDARCLGIAAEVLSLEYNLRASDEFSPDDFDSMLVMTNLGSSALASGSEGWSSEKAASLQARAVGMNSRVFRSAEVPSAVKKQLETLVATTKTVRELRLVGAPGLANVRANELMGAILSLAPGKSFCLIGGWIGRPSGHSMVYRFERNLAGSFNVYLYNAQGDSPGKEGGRRVGGSWESRPCYVFENVTSEELFFTTELPGQTPPLQPPPNSVMIRRLLELLVSEPGAGERRSLQDVLNCFCRLRPKLVPGDRMRNLFIRSQRSGNCAVKCINCLLMDLLNDRQAYKRQLLDERLLTLLVYRQNLYEKLRIWKIAPAEPGARELLRKMGILRRSARSFLTLLEKSYHQGAITLADYEQGFATVKDLLDELKVKGTEVRAARLGGRYLANEAISPNRPAQVLRDERTRRSEGVAALANLPPLTAPAVDQFSINADLGKNEPWPALGDVVRNLRKIMTDAGKSGSQQGAISQFELTMGHLFARLHDEQTPDGKVSFAGLDQGLAPAIQDDLRECLRLYSESVYGQNGIPSIRVQNTGMAAMALSYALGCWREAGSGQEALSNFGVYIEHFERLTGGYDVVSAPLDCVAVEQRNNLLSLWRKINGQAVHGSMLFNFESQEVNERAVGNDAVPELLLYNAYRDRIAEGTVPEDDTGWLQRRFDRFTRQKMTLFRALKHEGFPPPLAHIGALKQTALLAFGLFVPGDTSDIFQTRADVTNGLCYGVNGRSWMTGSDGLISASRIEEADYPGAGERRPERGRFAGYMVNTQHWHVQGSGGVQSENDLLALVPGTVPERDLALSEPAVQPFLLLGAIANNLTDLSKPEWRAFIETEFFKTVEVRQRNPVTGRDETTTVSPLGDCLRGDVALINQLDRLTDLCLKHLVESDPGDPKVEAILFIVRLRASVLANKIRLDPSYRLSTNSRSINERIFNWLRGYDRFLDGARARSELSSDDEREAALQKRRELRLAHAGLLLSLPTADIDSPVGAELFSLMLRINEDFQALSKVESRSFLRECRHQFSARADLWTHLPAGQLDSWANAIIADHDRGFFLPRTGWTFENGQLVLPAVAAGPDQPALAGYVIDLTRPVILKNGQELRSGTLILTDDLRRLFGSKQYEISREGPNGEIISFKDDCWGPIRIEGQGPDARIWRWYPNDPAGKWYLYRRGLPKDLKERLQINDALCYDHAHWLDVATNEVLIFDLRDGKAPLYRVPQSSEASTIPPSDGGPPPPWQGGESRLINSGRDPLEFCLLPKDFSAAVERFEDFGQVTVWSRVGDGSQTRFAHLEFPRFRMQDACLRFDWDDAAGWVYGADRRFKISTVPSLPLLDGLGNYLHLVQEERDRDYPELVRVVKRKVLVPVGKIKAKGFEERAEVELKSGAADGSKLSLQYFEYDYNEEKNELVPVPDTLEARVYLAHLYLGQKRYQDARAVLKKISMSANPSPEAVALLRELLSNGEGLHDLSPSACAVRLYAYLIFKKIKPRDERGAAIDYEKIGGDTSEHQTMADVYKSYLFAQRAVEAPLLFDPETELELFELLRVGDELAWRRQDLLREIDLALVGQGVALAVRPPSSGEAWELAPGGIPELWADLGHFVPKWPPLETFENATRRGHEDLLPYSERYADFATVYGKVRTLAPLEKEAFAFELISSKERLGFTEAQRALLLFAIGHPEFDLPIPPDGGDTVGRWKFCDELAKRYPLPSHQDLKLQTPMPAARPVLLPETAPVEQQAPVVALELAAAAAPVAATVAEAATPVTAGGESAPVVPMFSPVGLDSQLREWQELFLVNQSITTPPPAPTMGGEGERYASDRAIARENEALRPRLHPRNNPLGSVPTMTHIRDLCVGEETVLRGNILALANKMAMDVPQAIAAQITKDGRGRPDLDLNTVLRAAATSPAALQKLNPFLTPPEVETLRSICVDFMVVTTHREHVDRILKPLTPWVNEVMGANLAGRTPVIDPQWQQDFVDALAQSRTYNPYDRASPDHFRLLFEYMSGLRVWGNQGSIIRSVLNAIVDERDPFRQSKIFQRIMAGGKTSVIVSMLLEMISQSGQLPLVLCHHSQYASVSGNLHNFQESRYDKDVYAIDYDIQGLGDPQILQEIINKIQEADKKGCALLMKSSMPQVIELKLVTEALSLTEVRAQKDEYGRRLAEIDAELRTALPAARPALNTKKQKLAADLAELVEHEQKIMRNVGLLAQVIKTFKARGVGILDECDILLSMLMDVNVPRGGEEMLTPERAELVRDIYGILVADDILPPDPRQPPDQAPLSIRRLVDLENNNQAKLSKADFEQRVAPFVAGKLLDHYYRDFRLSGMWGDQPEPPPELRDAFVRYVGDAIPAAHQVAADRWLSEQISTLRDGEDLDLRVNGLPSNTPEECNVKFLCSLAALKRSENKYKQAAADKIALSGRIMRDVLPLALSRTCDRAYGRDPANPTGKVIPFLGMNEPAKTQFGYFYLALCYQFQAAVNKPISLEEVEFLAEKMEEAAQGYAQHARQPDAAVFENQPEAKWFFEVTGVHLTDARRDRQALVAAWRQINADPGRRLQVEAEIAPFHVKYYKERVSSNPINLAEQLRKMVGCSGTPWNWRSYHQKVGKLEEDRGVEGKIMNAMTERAARAGTPAAPYVGYQPITELDDDGLAPILQRIRNHPQKQRVRALIDAGGFLKGTNNALAAEAILQMYSEPGFISGQPPAIDAVIYLHQEMVDGKIREKFVLLKRLPDGSFRRETLADTSAATIANCGVPKEKIFVLFDELRTTGTDIPMADDTICLQTVEARMPIRTLLQASLRARGYFKGQDCEFLVTKKGRAEMQNGGATLPDIIDTLVQNQAVAVGEQAFRSYLAQITNSVRVAVLGGMLEDPEPDAVGGIAQTYRSFLVSTFEDNPYGQFARVEGPRPTADILQDHAKKTLFAYYWRRLELDTGPDEQGNPGLEAFAQALREYVDFVIITGRTQDRETTLLPVAQRVLDVGAPPQQLAKKMLCERLCLADRGQDLAVEGPILRLLESACQDLQDRILPPELRYQQGAEVDFQVEVERETEVTVEQEREQEQEQEVSQEIQTALAEMDLKTDGLRGYAEKTWVLPEVPPGGVLDLAALQVAGVTGVVPGFQAVQDVCRITYPPPAGNKLGQYAACFPGHLYMTDNLRRTFEGLDLPLLHRKMKTANFMLMIDSQPPGNPQCVLLSDRDVANTFGPWIKRCQPGNAWLIDMNGLEVVTNPGHPLPEGSLAWQDGLWAANLFNGNVSYLDRNEEVTSRIFNEVDPVLRQRMCDFAVMRAYYNPGKKTAALRSKLIVPSLAVLKTGLRVVFGARRLEERKRYEDVRSWDAEADWSSLPPGAVGNLLNTQLLYLATKGQVQQVPPEKMRFLVPEQANLLSPDQVAALRVGVPEELKLLQAVTDPDLFAQITDPAFIPFATAKQLPLFAPAQLLLLGHEQIKKLRLAEVARWPRTDPDLWRLAMVENEGVVPADLRDLLRRDVNTFAGLDLADVAGWLVQSLDRDHVVQLPHGRLNEISPEQARGLPPGLLRYLGRVDLVQALEDPGQIRNLDAEVVPQLLPGQKTVLRDYILGLDVGLLRDLPDWCSAADYAWPRFRRLTEAEFMGLRLEQQRWIREKVASLGVDELAQVAGCTDQRAPEYLSDHYLENVSSERLNELDGRHERLMSRLSRYRLQLLYGERVNLVPVGRLGELLPGQYLHITDGGRINAAIVGSLFQRNLRQEQLQKVPTVDLLLQLEDVSAGLSDAQVNMLVEHFEQVNLAQLQATLRERPWATDYAMRRLLKLSKAEADVLDPTTKEAIRQYIQRQQVVDIALWLADEYLDEHYLEDLSENQVNEINPSGEWLQITPDMNMARISKLHAGEQSALVKRLPPEKVRQIRLKHLVSLVPGDKVRYLRTELRQFIPIHVRPGEISNLLQLPDLEGVGDWQLDSLADNLIYKIFYRDELKLEDIPSFFWPRLLPVCLKMTEEQIRQFCPQMHEVAIAHLREFDAEAVRKWSVGQVDNHYLQYLRDDQFLNNDSLLRGYIQLLPVAIVARLLANGTFGVEVLKNLAAPQQLDAFNGDNPLEVALVNQLPPEQVQKLKRPQVQMITDPAILRSIDKKRQGDDFSPQQIEKLYPRKIGLRLAALAGLVFSSIFVVPLVFLFFSSTLRDWWHLAGAGVWSRDAYISARRSVLQGQ